MRSRAALVAVLVSAALSCAASGAAAQGSGTLLSQTVTVVKGGANPVVSFQVAGFKGQGTQTVIMLEIGPDGNATLPAANPSLPATARFTITKSSGGTRAFTLPASGSINDNNSNFAQENVSVDRLVENVAEPRGLYRIIVGHQHVIADVDQETWTLELVDVPAGLRVIASIQQGAFTALTPPPSPCGGTTPSGVCPPGQSCRGPCRGGPFIDWSKYVYVEFKWPRPRPGPFPCIKCPGPWQEPFDERQLDRVLVTFLPTQQQYAQITRGGEPDLRFNVTGGEPIGTPIEGAFGEFMQLVQHPRGQPPTVSLTGAGATFGEFRVERQLSADATRYRTASFTLGGLLAAALVGLAMSWRARRPRDPGTR